MKIVSPHQMRAIDEAAISLRGIPQESLMEAAGRAVAEAALRDVPGAATAIVLCGKGNNGGDGLVAARALSELGLAVEVVAPLGEDAWTGGAAAMRARLPDSVPVRTALPQDGIAWLSDADIVIDALLGIGSTGRPRPPIDSVIDALNAAHTHVVSIDIPSGLDAETGEGRGAVRAGHTVAIGLPKRGFFFRDGPQLTGRISVEAINFPPDLLGGDAAWDEILVPDEAAALLPPRPRDGHKGTFGMVAIAAGSAAMPGAAMLAAIGALRGGCGLVRVYAPPPVQAMIVARHPETLVPPLGRGSARTLSALTDDQWVDFRDRATAFVAGPGMGTDTATRDLVYQIIERSTVPLVLDADALNILAAEPALRRMLSKWHLLTPHPGEAARLLGTTASAVQADRWGAARQLADELGAVVLLKGHGSLVAVPGGPVCLVTTGNSALSKGGSGDVLAGLIGSLLAQGLAPREAALLGAWVHGRAADIAARGRSPRGITTSEIAERLPEAFFETEHPDRPAENP
jgi:NAD(P)H-hydrate epimerase